jgi:hypothetical protein
MLPIYLAGHPLELTVDLLDAVGNPLPVESIEWRLNTASGIPVLSLAPITDYVSGTPAATVAIAAPANALAVGEVRAAREVELECTLQSGEVVLISRVYVIESNETLQPGVNSYQTLTQAELVSLDYSQLLGWTAADNRAKRAALVEAKQRIERLRFRSYRNDAQNMLTDWVDAPRDLFLLTATEFNLLDLRFRQALCRAQVLEADSILDTESDDAKRERGTILEQVGEVKRQWRDSTPVKSKVCLAARQALSRWIDNSVRLARA